MYTIHGIQHLGVGVPEHEAAWKWYRKFFGLDVPFFNDEAPAPLMDIYTNNSTITKRAAMVMNLKGGCAMEVVSPTSVKAKFPEIEHQLGDLGIYMGKVKSPDVEKAFNYFKENGADVVSEIVTLPDSRKGFYVKDPQGLLFQVIEIKNEYYTNYNHVCGGIVGCVIGVSDIEKSRTLYSDILGYDKVIYDETGEFEDLKSLKGGNTKFRRVLLTQENPSGGGFTRLSGSTYIELIQEISERVPVKLYKGRIWGDVGFVHLGFDVRGMNELGEVLAKAGFGFTCNTNDVLSMGDSTKVHCTYIEDPDGSWLELIEVYKIPIIEKWGIHLNVEKRAPNQPLPDILLKAMRFMRIKD